MRIILIFAALLLVGCVVEPSSKDIKLGPLSATGTITSTGSSLHRRGTHLLLMDGRPRFFLESKTINLNAYGDDVVLVQGDLSPNTHTNFLPVLEVVSVRSISENFNSVLQSYTVRPLRLSLDAPTVWMSNPEGARMTFRILDEEDPFIALEKIDIASWPEGVPLRIDGRNAVRIVEEATGVHRVYVRRSDEEIILFTFGPKGEESLRQRDAFYSMLRSIRFVGEVDNVHVEESFGGSMQPCGGSAGVTCPDGEYCAITEIATGIGICRTLQ